MFESLEKDPRWADMGIHVLSRDPWYDSLSFLIKLQIKFFFFSRIVTFDKFVTEEEGEVRIGFMIPTLVLQRQCNLDPFFQNTLTITHKYMCLFSFQVCRHTFLYILVIIILSFVFIVLFLKS